jgi:hypothetical protein
MISDAGASDYLPQILIKHQHVRILKEPALLLTRRINQGRRVLGHLYPVPMQFLTRWVTLVRTVLGSDLSIGNLKAYRDFGISRLLIWREELIFKILRLRIKYFLRWWIVNIAIICAMTNSKQIVLFLKSLCNPLHSIDSLRVVRIHNKFKSVIICLRSFIIGARTLSSLAVLPNTLITVDIVSKYRLSTSTISSILEY